MTTCTNRLSFGGLQRELDQMLDRLWNSGGPWVPAHQQPGAWTPPVRAWQKEHEFVVETELPGVTEEGLNIQVLANTLTIEGTRELPNPGENGRWLARERAAQTFRRVVTLPTDVDAEQVSATLTDGVLTVTLPQAEAARPKKIQVARV